MSLRTGKKPLQLYFLTGFLGSGKTTFLKNILSELGRKNLKAGVIVNEFGQVGIDGTVIKDQALEIRELNDGQIFCGCMQGKFINAIAQLTDYPLDYLIVESSGLANPTSLNRVLGELKKLAGEKYIYRGMLCLVDPVKFLPLVKTVNAVEEQIIHSECILINKLDLATKEVLAQVKAKIKELNPHAPIYKGSYGSFPFDILELDFSVSEQEKVLNEPVRNVKVPFERPKHYLIQTEKSISQEKLREFLQSIAQDTFRIKGFAKCEGKVLQVDVVNTALELRSLKLKDSGENKEPFSTEIVVISSIGSKLASELEDKWQKIIGVPVTIKENIFNPPTYNFNKVV